MGGKGKGIYRKRGTGNINSDGYKRISQALEHRLIAEKVLGKPLPAKAVVHHLDGKAGQGSPLEIVICQDQAYHMLLHQRTRAYRACGNADWRKCCYCKQYDDPANLKIKKNNGVFHVNCQKEYDKRRTRNV